MLTKQDRTKAICTPAVKGLAWNTDGFKMREGTGAGAYGQSVGRRVSFSLGRYAMVFQAEIYGILACAHEVQSQSRMETYASICSDSLAALKACTAVKTSPLVYQCHRALNDISIQQVVGLLWVLGHVGKRGNKIAESSRRVTLL